MLTEMSFWKENEALYNFMFTRRYFILNKRNIRKRIYLHTG